MTTKANAGSCTGSRCAMTVRWARPRLSNHRHPPCRRKRGTSSAGSTSNADEGSWPSLESALETGRGLRSCAGSGHMNPAENATLWPCYRRGRAARAVSAMSRRDASTLPALPSASMPRRKLATVFAGSRHWASGCDWSPVMYRGPFQWTNESQRAVKSCIPDVHQN
jgi:hypothetical protein